MQQVKSLFGRLRRVSAAAAFVAAAFVLVVGCSNTPEEPETRTKLVLGTTVTIRIYEGAEEAIFERAFDRVTEIEERMSTSTADYQTTELLEVNRAAGENPVEVSEDTFYVVQRGLEYSRMTDGAFDITIGPLVDLWGIGTEYAAVPEAQEIEELLPTVDYTRVQLDPEERTIYLPEPGMGLDVGGIAKGYAAEEVARILREEGIEHALLDFGGNILFFSSKRRHTRL